ncbi:MAG: hypothetical protein V8T86_03310 [Victivallis sp.]
MRVGGRRAGPARRRPHLQRGSRESAPLQGRREGGEGGLRRGIRLDNFADFLVNDEIEIYEIELKKATLSNMAEKVDRLTRVNALLKRELAEAINRIS